MQNFSSIPQSQVTCGNISQFQNVISEFAKANKVSRAKVEAFTAAIVASIPKQPSKENTGKGRPMSEKTRALHKAIIDTINNGYQSKRDAALVRKVVSVDYPDMDKVTFNNALQTLVKQGKIYRAGKAKTGSRGRQPFILTTNKPEGVLK